MSVSSKNVSILTSPIEFEATHAIVPGSVGATSNRTLYPISETLDMVKFVNLPWKWEKINN